MGPVPGTVRKSLQRARPDIVPVGRRVIEVGVLLERNRTAQRSEKKKVIALQIVVQRVLRRRRGTIDAVAGPDEGQTLRE